MKDLRMQHDLRKCVQKYIDSGFELIRGERLLLVRGTRRYEIHNGIVRVAA